MTNTDIHPSLPNNTESTKPLDAVDVDATTASVGANNVPDGVAEIINDDVVVQLAQLWKKWDEQKKEDPEKKSDSKNDIDQKTILNVVQSKQFKSLPDEVKCYIATIAAWRNHAEIVSAAKDSCENPDMVVLHIADTLPPIISDNSNLDIWLDDQRNNTSGLTQWNQGVLNHPLEKRYTENMQNSLGLVGSLSDETISSLCAHTDGYSKIEQYIFNSHVDFKVYFNRFVEGVVLRGLSLNHTRWQNQPHPMHPQHTIYDVLVGLLYLADCNKISSWVKQFSLNPMCVINQRAVVDYKIELLSTGYLKDLPAGCKRDTARSDFLQWCKNNEFDGEWMEKYCKVNHNALDYMNTEQSACYREQVKNLVKKAIENPELFNDAQYLTPLAHTHPLLDLYASKYVYTGDFTNLISSQINWNMFEGKKNCDVMLKTPEARIALVKCIRYAPPIGSDTIIQHLLKYWCYTDYAPHFQAASWNIFWKCCDRTAPGVLTFGEMAVCAAIEKMTVFEKWSAMCAYIKMEDIDAQREKVEQWKEYIPQTWDDLIALKPCIEDVLKKLKTWPTETPNSDVFRELFTEENRIKSVADLDHNGKKSNMLASWSEFLKKNPSGLRRCARAKDAAKGIDLLRDAFPHFEKIVNMLESDLALAMMGKGDFFIPPLLMDGPPGTGKTFFFNELARVAKNDFHIFNMESVTAGATFTGLDRMWGNTGPGELFEKMIKNDAVVNPIVLLDELDKVRKGDDYPVAPVLLSLLEPHSAKKFIDRSVQLPLDVSRISWVATSNFIEKIDVPVRSRFRVVTVPSPNFAARMKMSRIIETFLRSENPWGSAFHPTPNETLQVLCAPEGSARDLRKNLTHAFATAARQKRSTVLPEDLPPAQKQPPIDPWDVKYEEIPTHIFAAPLALENHL